MLALADESVVEDSIQRIPQRHVFELNELVQGLLCFAGNRNAWQQRFTIGLELGYAASLSVSCAQRLSTERSTTLC